jgi:hypothetical protein
MWKLVRYDRFHGRVNNAAQACSAPGCAEPGEFRAPGSRSASADGPGEYRWFCLGHVREFNAGYDWFEGMSAEQIFEAQHPVAGWQNESPSVRAVSGVDAAPRWADFADPLEAIAARARARARRPAQRVDGRAITAGERRALAAMDLPLDTDRTALRKRYLDLVRRLHPDRNGGDRRHEARLQTVIEAYQLLRGSRMFA